MVAAAAISLLTLITLGVVVIVLVPVAAEDALTHSQGFIGESYDTYSWKCPNASGYGYNYERFEMHVGEEDFIESTRGGALRQSTKLVSCPYIMVDPGDKYVQMVAQYLIGMTEGYSDEMRAQAALNFVQCAIWYEYDIDLYGTEDFWASPVETLYLHSGDCEDTSVLLCSIYLAMGYRCAMLDFPGHVAVGVYLGDSEDYLFCETTFDSPHGLGYGGFGSNGTPEVHDDFSGSLLTDISGFFAGYRNLIRSVTGA